VTLWPRTLLWRTVLLLALLLLAAQGAWLLLNGLVERDMRARQIAHHAITAATLTRGALVAAQPERRRALLAELSERQGIRIFPATARTPEPALFEPPVIALVREQIREELGPATVVVLERGARPRALWVSLDIEGERYWLALSSARVERALPWRWLGWASAVLLLSLAGAYLLVRRVNRPLRRLTDAAAALGRGESPQPLPEAGPAEVRTLTRTFNRMAGDLQRLEAERKLMLAGVSHDLRTPLARLRLAVEMLPQAEAAKGMTQDIEDMDAIIGQFLAFVREGAGEQAQPTDLNQLVRAAGERYARTGQTIALQLKPLPSLSLRPTAAQRMVSNLIDNALKYGRTPGEDRAAVELHTWQQAGTVYLSVLDRGPGVPPDQVARLLQPFTREELARTGASGSGLGLAIVDRIARWHGGSLALLPRAGGGLDARVALPVPASHA
jgi:two-component system osmolarity sensor histidine kinase EnvZ